MADENEEDEMAVKISNKRELTEAEQQRQFEIVKSALSRAS
jgi:hypothetical protein